MNTPKWVGTSKIVLLGLANLVLAWMHLVPPEYQATATFIALALARVYGGGAPDGGHVPAQLLPVSLAPPK